MLELTMYGLFVVLMLECVFFAYKLLFAFRHFTLPSRSGLNGPLAETPSVSVCIPARNEAHAVTACLERVIASRYPKLEIIVLDDGSGDDTSSMIKSFANAGVRFVEGSPLPAGWLGKNHALQGLLSEASGSFVLFLDVDTQVAPDTIGLLVEYLQRQAASMVSVLPRRQDSWRASVLFGTLRYFWELLLHRRSAPAVASSAWLVDRQTLIELGGFGPYRHDVQPEAKLAATLMAHRSYRFLIGTTELGISYEKKWTSQIDTSIRLLCPILGGHLLLSLLALLGLVLLNLPLAVVAAGAVTGWTPLQTVAIGLLGVYGTLYSLYLNRVWRRGWWLGLILWPLVVVQESVVLMVSIDQYRRRDVTWKGRPITTE